jgi:hypothetical protein
MSDKDLREIQIKRSTILVLKEYIDLYSDLCCHAGLCAFLTFNTKAYNIRDIKALIYGRLPLLTRFRFWFMDIILGDYIDNNYWFPNQTARVTFVNKLITDLEFELAEVRHFNVN